MGEKDVKKNGQPQAEEKPVDGMQAEQEKEANKQDAHQAEAGTVETTAPEKKRSRTKLIVIIAAVIVVLAALGCWFSGLVGGISEAEARQIACQQIPGATTETANAAFVHREFDDFRVEYDVQIQHDNTLYEFTILKRNGKITSQDVESIGTIQNNGQTQTQAGQQQAQTQTQQAADIGVEKAKEIALTQVSGAAASNIVKAKSDYDNGRLIYEIEIQYQGQEYDFDIAAEDGSIVKQSVESIHD